MFRVDRSMMGRHAPESFYGLFVKEILELLLQGFSPDGRRGIGWHGEGLVGQRRSPGEKDPVSLSQDLHEPSIHSPSPPCWPKMAQTAAYAGRGDRLLPPKTPTLLRGIRRLLRRKTLRRRRCWGALRCRDRR